MDIYILTCEDASHLGGPMGSEYTTLMWTEVFTSLDKAKAHAEKHWWREDSRWDRAAFREAKWSADVGPYIYTIEKKRAT